MEVPTTLKGRAGLWESAKEEAGEKKQPPYALSPNLGQERTKKNGERLEGPVLGKEQDLLVCRDIRRSSVAISGRSEGKGGSLEILFNAAQVQGPAGEQHHLAHLGVGLEGGVGSRVLLEILEHQGLQQKEKLSPRE